MKPTILIIWILSIIPLPLIADGLHTVEKDLEPLRVQFEKKRAEALEPLYEIYLKELKKKEKKFTRAGNLDLALAARKKFEEAKAEMLADTQRDLIEALMKYTWGWHPKGSGVRLKFNKDGTVWHIGMHGNWAMVDKRRILISPVDGHRKVLMEFNDDLSSWKEVDGEFGGIRREARKPKK